MNGEELGIRFLGIGSRRSNRDRSQWDPSTMSETPSSSDVHVARAPGSVRSGLGFAAFAALLALLVYGGLALYADVEPTAAALREVDGATIALALALSSASFVLRFVRWHVYLHRIGAVVPVGASFAIYLAGFALTVSPAKVGELLRSALLHRRHGVDIARTAPLLVVERLTDLVALTLLASLGFFGRGSGTWLACLGVALAVALVALPAWHAPQRALSAFGARFQSSGRFVERLARALEAGRRVATPLTFLWATTIGVMAWGLQCLALRAVANGFEGVALGFREAATCYALPLIAGALALVPGGLGFTEASMTGLLQSFGAPELDSSRAVATTAVVRLTTLWWAVAVGVVALLSTRRARGFSTG
jgi:uncharacterized membrane protein YbhN (UPF0104 family)